MVQTLGRRVVAGLGALALVVTLPQAAAASPAADLQGGPDSTVSAAPGDAVKGAFSVTNNTDATVSRPVAWLRWVGGLRPDVRPANCFFAATEAYCEFDADLAAHTRYALDAPLRYSVAPTTYAPRSSNVSLYWLTAAQAEQRLADLRAQRPVPGTGPALGLVAAPTLPAGDADNASRLLVAVTGSQGADLQARGSTARGAVGSTVRATIGVYDAGPADLEFIDFSTLSKLTLFTVPVGTTAVTVPAGCASYIDGSPVTPRPGTPQYVCTVKQIGAGETVPWVFTLRIDRPGQLRGTAEVNYVPPFSRTGGPDLDPGNDIAAVTVIA